MEEIDAKKLFLETFAALKIFDFGAEKRSMQKSKIFAASKSEILTVFSGPDYGSIWFNCSSCME